MNQLTIRGFDEDLDRYIRALARSEGISLNQAALRLLRKASGLGAAVGGRGAVGDALDEFFGTWSDEEAGEFMDVVRDFDRIDEGLWR